MFRLSFCIVADTCVGRSLTYMHSLPTDHRHAWLYITNERAYILEAGFTAEPHRSHVRLLLCPISLPAPDRKLHSDANLPNSMILTSSRQTTSLIQCHQDLSYAAAPGSVVLHG